MEVARTREGWCLAVRHESCIFPRFSGLHTSMTDRPLHDPQARPLHGATVETRNTNCYMCACRCGIGVHLRDAQVLYIDGNPDHPLNHGFICAKGSSGIMKQYSPARLTKPLVRKPGSERGAGEFVPVSWDEAFSIL